MNRFDKAKYGCLALNFVFWLLLFVTWVAGGRA